MLPTKFWAEMSWRDFAAADMSKVVAVLPVAAIKQHGPHLPVGVDTFINEGYFARAVRRIPDEMPVLILPTQAIGKSNEHIDPDRQVRPMLLDRGHRQNRDDFAHVGGGKVTPAHLGPELGWQHLDLPALKALARRRPRSRP